MSRRRVKRRKDELDFADFEGRESTPRLTSIWYWSLWILVNPRAAVNSTASGAMKIPTSELEELEDDEFEDEEDRARETRGRVLMVAKADW